MALQFAVGGALLPFISMILRDRGLDFRQISVVFLAASSTLLVFPFLWGMLADRYLPLNRLFALLNVGACVALTALLVQRSYVGPLLSFMLFFACFTPTLTLVNALSFHFLHDPRTQFGMVRAWGSLGWIIPSLPIYLWFALAEKAGFDFVVLLAMGFALAMAALALFLPHAPPGAGRRTGNGQLAYWPAMKRLMNNVNYLTILASLFLMAGSHSILLYYSPPFLEDLGVARAWIGPIQSIGVALEIVLFQWQPLFFGRWDYQATISVGCLALFLRHLLFSFCANKWLLSASYLLAGVVIVFYNIGISVLVNSLATREVRATAQSMLVFFGSGTGPMFANWAAGRVAKAAGNDLRPVFLLAASLAGLAGLLILARGRKLDHAGHTAGGEVRH